MYINTDSYQFSFAIIENTFNEKEKYSQFPVHHFFAWYTQPDLKGAAEKTNMITKVIYYYQIRSTAYCHSMLSIVH